LLVYFLVVEDLAPINPCSKICKIERSAIFVKVYLSFRTFPHGSAYAEMMYSRSIILGISPKTAFRPEMDRKVAIERDFARRVSEGTTRHDSNCGATWVSPTWTAGAVK